MGEDPGEFVPLSSKAGCQVYLNSNADSHSTEQHAPFLTLLRILQQLPRQYESTWLLLFLGRHFYSVINTFLSDYIYDAKVAIPENDIHPSPAFQAQDSSKAIPGKLTHALVAQASSGYTKPKTARQIAVQSFSFRQEFTQYSLSRYSLSEIKSAHSRSCCQGCEIDCQDDKRVPAPRESQDTPLSSPLFHSKCVLRIATREGLWIHSGSADRSSPSFHLRSVASSSASHLEQFSSEFSLPLAHRLSGCGRHRFGPAANY